MNDWSMGALQEEVKMEEEWQKVLSFWFGDSASEREGLRKTLWFIPDKNQALRDERDAEIKEKYGELVEKAQKGLLDHSWGGPHSSAHQVLSLVIVLDQFSRHVFRGNAAAVNKCTAKALQHTLNALERKLDAHLQTSHLCFLLMPMRHFVQTESNEFQTISLSRRDAMSLLESKLVERRELERAESAILERFEAATDRRSLLPMASSAESFSDEEILDPVCVAWPMTGQEEDMASEPLYQSMLRFLVNKLGDLVKNSERVQLFVSLSGGVDSMVIAKILSHISSHKDLSDTSLLKPQSRNEILKKKKNRKRRKVDMAAPCQAKNDTSTDSASPVNSTEMDSLQKKGIEIQVHAVHIDYGNREESGAEADFVKRWCHSHEINFIERKITEIKRGVTARDDYERQSRAIRFQAYRDAMGNEPVGIMFGHHKGDVQENVISNVMKGCSVMEISGMTEESTIDGVRVWRPLLQHEKSEIFQFAERFRVPYFKDTTPKWSTRGKLRDTLIPTIASTYGGGFRHNLSSLAMQSDELNTFLRAILFEPFWTQTNFGRIAVDMPLEGFLDHPGFFWKFALRHVCHAQGQGAVKDRACMILTDTLNNRRLGSKVGSKCQWIVLKQKQPSFIYLPSPRRLVMFHEGAMFSAHQACADLVLRAGDSMRFDKYIVSVQSCESSSMADTEERFDLFDWLKTGSTTYCLSASPSATFSLCPVHGHGLAFFHNVDRSVRIGMPIVSPVQTKDSKAEPNCRVSVTIEFNPTCS